MGVCWGLRWGEMVWVGNAHCASSSWARPRGWEPHIPLEPATVLPRDRNPHVSGEGGPVRPQHRQPWL